MILRATAMEPDRRDPSRRKAYHLAWDISVVVAALLLWALLSHLPWYQLWTQNPAEDCVFLGRAGAHCVGTGAAPANCESMGRAGRYCALGTTSPWAEPIHETGGRP